MVVDRDTVTLKFKKVHENARLPRYSNSTCFDLYAATVNGKDSDVVHPGHPAIIGTGLVCKIPVGYAFHIVPRRSWAFHYRLEALNSVIDCEYDSEIRILLRCWHLDEYELPLHVYAGDRVAQAYIIKVLPVTLEEI